MNLFRKHKKFEEQLNEQLGDMEVKPSASLWDRIDADITDGPFEQNVQNSLENFEQMPYPETWDKIASELPEEKAGRGLTKYVVSAALALLFVAGIYIGRNWNPAPQTTIAYSESAQPADEVRKSEKPVAEAPARIKSVEVAKEKQETPQSAAQQEVHNAEPAKVPVQKYQPEVLDSKTTKTVSSKPEDAVSVAEVKPVKKASSSKTVAIIPKIGPGAGKPRLETKHRPKIETLVAANNTPEEKAEEENSTPPAATEVPAVTPGQEIKAASQAPVEEAPVSLQQPREVTAVQSDSLAVAQKMEEIKNYKDEETLTGISISAYAGINVCYTTYNAPKQPSTLNFDKNIALRKELERPTVDWSGGFLLDYRIGQRWMISSGVMMTNFNQKFDYSIQKAQSPSNINETGAPTSNPSDSFAVGNQYSNRIKFSWTEIPLFINYHITNSVHWNLDMQAGISYGFLNTVDGGMIGYDNKGVLVLRGKESFPNIQNALFVSAMPQISYQFTPTVALGFAPTVKYSITSIIGNERWIQQHPYFIGANICLRKRF